MSASDEFEENMNPTVYSCKKCKKIFPCKRSQLIHKKEVHSQVKSSYQCKICSKFFCNGGNLDRHMKVHQDVRPHVCRICSKAFSQAVNLQRHYSVHNGERPFQCNFCTKSFTQLSNMQRHQLIHTGEKPFRCTRCGRYFSQRVNLKKHILGHLDTKPYSCKFCEKAFVQLTNLRRHLQSHIKDGMIIDMSSTLKEASELARHSLELATQKEPIGYECAICRTIFDDFSKFELHESDCPGTIAEGDKIYNELKHNEVRNKIRHKISGKGYDTESEQEQDLQSMNGQLIAASFAPIKFDVNDMLDTHEIIVETSH